MKKKWWDEAFNQYVEWQNKDKKILKKINNIIKDIDRNGYNCGSHLEQLKENLSGWYSVEIDKKNRIVFKINEKNELEIMQCGTHYK